MAYFACIILGVGLGIISISIFHLAKDNDFDDWTERIAALTARNAELEAQASMLLEQVQGIRRLLEPTRSVKQP